MRRFVGIIAAAAVAVCLGATPAGAQQGTADLQGRAVDQQGAALPGVSIVVRHQASGLYREATSGPDGSFLLSAMTPGVYEITAELTGFRKYTRRDVQLEVGRTLQVEVKMDVGGLQESVTVTGESPIVDTTSKEIGGIVQTKELVDVPSFNRNFAGYLGMLPGVVATVSLTTFGADSISVAGQNVRNVNYTMDGSNNNDTFNGGNGGAQARVPVEAVQEFQLLTSQFDAEYGLASGGVVNSVSKQGTNQFHGSGFAFFQDEKLSARDYFGRRDDLPEAQTKQQQYGGTLGGPIIRNKAHFFTAVERVLIDGGTTMIIPSRPEFNRTDFETTRVWNTFVRGDHQVNADHTWGIRWLREDSPQPVQLNSTTWATPARYEAETDTDWTFVGNLSSVFGSNKVNTFRVSAVTEDVFFGNPAFNGGADQKTLGPTLNHPGWSDGQSGRANRRLDVAYGSDDTFAWFVPGKGGDHDFKFGYNYLYSTLRIQDFGNLNGAFSFNSNLDFDPNNPRTYPERLSIRVPGPVDFLMYGHFIGVFAQDKWRPNPRLTLSLGLRYDVEVLPTPNQDNPLFADDPNGYPMDTNNFSPRIGFSLAMDSNGQSAIRGGVGQFYQRTSYTFLTGMFSGGRFSNSFTQLFPLNNVDAGPSSGNFPSEELLRNGPVVNHALIDRSFPPGTRTKNTGTVRFDNPDREVAWSRQYSIGYERSLGSALGVSVDFIRSEQRKQYVLKDLNPGLRRTTSRTGTVDRNNPLVGEVGEFSSAVNTLVNEGWINYNSLQVSIAKRYSKGYQARVSYSYSKGKGNTPDGQGGSSNSQLLGDLRLDQEIGPTSVDRPHILSINGSYDVPRTGGLTVSGVVQARSGTPFTLTDTRFDLDRNGTTANEYMAAGTYSGVGQDAYSVDYKGGRAGARGPNYLRVDFRAGYRFKLRGGRTLQASLDVFNLTDEPNFANPSGDFRFPDTFLILTDINTTSPTRTAQLNLRYAF